MRKLNLGIIGAGRIAYVHARSITYNIPHAEIKIIADPYMTDEAKKWIAEFNIQTISRDYKDVINDPEVDAVLVCSSTNTHAQCTREAAIAGKHVFCEKPIDLDIREIKKTIDVVEKSGVKFQVGFNRRFDHNFMALREAVAKKTIGELHLVKITSRDPSPPPLDYVKVSGGLFMDMTIHDFDMVRYLTGSEVDEIFAYGNVLVDTAIGSAGDIDTAIISMKMKSGAMAVIDNSRKAAYGYDQRGEVFGSLGMMVTGNDTPHTGTFWGEEGLVAQKPLYFFLERYREAFSHEMIEFVHAVAEGRPVPVGGIDGLNSVILAAAAAESLKQGKSITVSY
jgi:myo-inositol 2-dehydrogenase/D-chiro-inositol 1-dehydrogenase